VSDSRSEIHIANPARARRGPRRRREEKAQSSRNNRIHPRRTLVQCGSNSPERRFRRRRPREKKLGGAKARATSTAPAATAPFRVRPMYSASSAMQSPVQPTISAARGPLRPSRSRFFAQLERQRAHAPASAFLPANSSGRKTAAPRLAPPSISPLSVRMWMSRPDLRQNPGDSMASPMDLFNAPRMGHAGNAAGDRAPCR